MTYYAVIDTNVIVSSMLKENSIPWQIMNLVRQDVIVPLLNEEILQEYFDVITRNKFHFNNELVENTIGQIRAKSIFLEREQTLEDFVDKDDIVFFEIVMSAKIQWTLI